MISDTRIFVVIVTFNGVKWLEACFKSVLNSSMSTAIIVVDNGSTDGSLDLIKSKYPTIHLIKQNDNLGFGKANNIGISKALSLGADNVFLLNQDTIIKNDCLEKLLEISKTNSEYGILSPVHFNYKGTSLEYYFEQFMSKNDLLAKDIKSEKFSDSVYEVPFVNAAAWFITKKTFKIIGGFDPIFHHYGEDNNYCQRLNYHHLKIGIVPNAEIYHDSKKRSKLNIPLFSKEYYGMEVKQLQIRYADINRSFNSVNIKNIRRHNVKLILQNLLKLNFGNVQGYIKKYQIFEKEIERIKHSRKLNQVKGSHYL